MAETRTKIQIEANKIDLDLYNLRDRLLAFGDDNNLAEIRAFAHELSARRYLVRKHMHKADRETTT